MEREKNKNGLIIGLLIFIIVLLIGIVTYLIIQSDIFTKKEDNKEVENSSVEEKIDEENEIADIDLDKSLNTTDYSYELDNDLTIDDTSVRYNENNKKYEIVINWDSWKALFPDSDKTGNEVFTIDNLSKNVKEAIVGTIYQTQDSEVVLFLMEDGTIDYIPLFKALEQNDIKSYGNIKDVNGVVKFYFAQATPKDDPYGNYITTLAQTKDGSFYDLRPLLHDEVY